MELTDAIFKKANKVFEKALTGGKSLTREALFGFLGKAKIDTQANRGSHILLNAELDRLICNGPMKDSKQTYALLEERVEKPVLLTKDESLQKLVHQYFTSRGPATLQDFVWWSGLPIGEAKKGLEFVRDDLIAEKIDGQTYWFSASVSNATKNKSLYLLPAFDEYIISYKDKSANIAKELQSKTFTNNGIFKSVAVINGQVAGVWKRATDKDKLSIEIDFFEPQKLSVHKLVEKQAAHYGSFLAKGTTVINKKT